MGTRIFLIALFASLIAEIVLNLIDYDSLLLKIKNPIVGIILTVICDCFFFVPGIVAVIYIIVSIIKDLIMI